MIYCFSGTGNSQWVADKLKETLSLPLSPSQGESERVQGTSPDGNPSPSQGEMSEGQRGSVWGLIFPVYGWGLPKVVAAYIQAHQEEIKAAQYVWAVMTCGDDIGYTDKILQKALGREVDLVISVRMPNTYVCLPGFDIDKDDVAQAKVQETRQRIPSIAQSIQRREHKTDVVRGRFAWLKTYVLRPLFNRFLVTDKYFHTTKNCIRCKRCVRGCPQNNITTDPQGRIIWKHENCTGCLRCYHRCPCLAIQFGQFTKNKGQKLHDFD